MRTIKANEIITPVAELCVKANHCLRPDLQNALTKARQHETAAPAQSALDTFIENYKIAEREKLPICQDTGMAVVFVTLGRDLHIDGDLAAAINEGVRQGYKAGYCRSSVVADPIRRTNTGDNTPAVIHYDFAPGDELHITVAPKGFGSENMSGVKMLTPSDGLEAAEDFIVETVRAADANPCPPIIVGVGLGGTMEKAALLSKQALLRDVGSENPDPFWAEAEARLLEKINALGIGPAGYGGKTTALAVHILTYPTHIAGLPLAVNIGCHVTRHQGVII